jgi:hypothetical protein
VQTSHPEQLSLDGFELQIQTFHTIWIFFGGCPESQVDSASIDDPKEPSARESFFDC